MSSVAPELPLGTFLRLATITRRLPLESGTYGGIVVAIGSTEYAVDDTLAKDRYAVGSAPSSGSKM